MSEKFAHTCNFVPINPDDDFMYWVCTKCGERPRAKDL